MRLLVTVGRIDEVVFTAPLASLLWLVRVRVRRRRCWSWLTLTFSSLVHGLV
jgi:hypothetical protein